MVLDTDYDFSVVDDPSPPTSSVNHKNIGSVWRDIVVEDQMEGCLNRLEVTTKKGYADVDDPNHGFRDPYHSQMYILFKYIYISLYNFLNLTEY